MKKLKGFTLAEILVTLMIIGVIAAMTIPSLNQNTKNNEYAAGCLKAYSVLSQATNRIKLDYGPIGLGKKWNDKDELLNEYKKQFNVVATDSANWNSRKLKFLNGTIDNNVPGQAFMTTDGFMWLFDSNAISSAVYTSLITADNVKNTLFRIMVDVNGMKGPNVYGRDIFVFVLVKGIGIIPVGAASTADCIKTNKGLSCAAKVVKEKKMNY